MANARSVGRVWSAKIMSAYREFFSNSDIYFKISVTKKQSKTLNGLPSSPKIKKKIACVLKIKLLMADLTFTNNLYQFYSFNLLIWLLADRVGFADFQIALVHFKNNYTTLSAIRQTKMCRLNK